MSDLKPCPFCGGEARLTYSMDNHHHPYVTCDTPRCPGRNTYQWHYHTEAEAIEAWNKRAKRKKGKWVRRKDEDCWECSECHAVLENSDIGNHNFYYCYHCGADMMDICGYMDLEKANYE